MTDLKCQIAGCKNMAEILATCLPPNQFCPKHSPVKLPLLPSERIHEIFHRDYKDKELKWYQWVQAILKYLNECDSGSRPV